MNNRPKQSQSLIGPLVNGIIDFSSWRIGTCLGWSLAYIRRFHRVAGNTAVILATVHVFKFVFFINIRSSAVRAATYMLITSKTVNAGLQPLTAV